MWSRIVDWGLVLLGLYALCGLLWGVPFVLRGVGRIDPDARAATWGFRLAILPGVVALWPLLARRPAVGAELPARERTPHRQAAKPSAPR